MIQEYLRFRTAMGFSGDHEKQLTFFDRFCCERYPHEHCLNAEVVRKWISYEIAQGRSGLPNKASAIRLFAKYLGKGAYILPMDYVSRKSSFAPYVFTDEELAVLFRAADTLRHQQDSFLSVTIPVLLRLLYACGLRPNEGRCLKRGNICFETGEILITKTKRNKERIVVMSDDMLALMKQYDIRRTFVAPGNEYFFVRSNGEAIKSRHLHWLFQKCWKAANPNVAPHLLPHARMYDLRHRYASTVLQNWIDEGRNLYAMLPFLRSYMGHERLTDTAYYIHILPERLLLSPCMDWERLDSTVPEVNVWRR
jgi:integrase